MRWLVSIMTGVTGAAIYSLWFYILYDQFSWIVTVGDIELWVYIRLFLLQLINGIKEFAIPAVIIMFCVNVGIKWINEEPEGPVMNFMLAVCLKYLELFDKDEDFDYDDENEEAAMLQTELRERRDNRHLFGLALVAMIIVMGGVGAI